MNAIPILKIIARLKTGRDILNISINEYNIGVYIYDHLLRTFVYSTIDVIKPAARFRLAIEITYFYYFLNLFKKYNIKTIVISDNVYRYGLLFEIAKIKKIDCYAPISLNTYSISKYCDKNDYLAHCRKPMEKILKERCLPEKIDCYLDDYFKKRFSSSIEQHDVMNAFSKSRAMFNAKDIRKKYALGEDKPLVILMAHIFCDAPHAFPSTLYSDYQEWLIESVRALRKNKNIYFFVKEHPSAELYGENGLIEKILDSIGERNRLIAKDINSLSIILNFDYVVTCGGTIGQEFAYIGKRPILAAKPPYSGFGFTVEPKTRYEYEQLLTTKIQNIKPLTESEKKVARSVMYHDFVLMNNFHTNLEIGSQRYYMGKEYNMGVLYEDIIDYNLISLFNQSVYKKLYQFVNSNDKRMLVDDE